MTISIRSSTPVVPIDDTARQTALRFAQQQPTPQKAMQVYRNTLAVLAAQHCLDLLGIPTALADSECWNPFSRLAADVADLPVTGLGCLECRPVSPDQECCYVPPEVLENRIGYLVVQVAPPYQEAIVLGFSPSAIDESLFLTQLHPFEALLLDLELRRQALAESQKVSSLLTRLSQWLDQVVDASSASLSLDGERLWRPVETLLGPLHEPALRTFQDLALNTPAQVQKIVEQLYASQQLELPRSPRSLSPDASSKVALVHLIQTVPDEETRWKAAEILWTIDPGHPATGVRRVLDLGLVLAGQPLALMVAVLQAGDRGLSVLARVYPLAEQGYLPPKLHLAVLDSDGTLGLETQSRTRDNCIQLKSKGEFGERFSIQLRLETDVITEYFVI